MKYIHILKCHVKMPRCYFCVDYQFWVNLPKRKWKRKKLNAFSSFDTHLFLNKRINVQATTNNACALYEDGIIAERTSHKWYARLRCRNFYLGDRERSADEDYIKRLIENIQDRTKHCRDTTYLMQAFKVYLDAAIITVLVCIMILQKKKLIDPILISAEAQ